MIAKEIDLTESIRDRTHPTLTRTDRKPGPLKSSTCHLSTPRSTWVSAGNTSLPFPQLSSVEKYILLVHFLFLWQIAGKKQLEGERVYLGLQFKKKYNASQWERHGGRVQGSGCSHCYHSQETERKMKAITLFMVPVRSLAGAITFREGLPIRSRTPPYTPPYTNTCLDIYFHGGYKSQQADN